jgi:hypothetical protein
MASGVRVFAESLGDGCREVVEVFKGLEVVENRGVS